MNEAKFEEKIQKVYGLDKEELADSSVSKIKSLENINKSILEENKKFKVASSTECSNCEKLGSYMPVVATFGLKIADYVLKRLTQI